MTTLKTQIDSEISSYFGGDFYRYFIFMRTYSRFIEEKGRRETWVEVVDRYISFMNEKLGDKLSKEEYEEIKMAILKQEVMPSMRLLWSAGDAVRKNNATAYNCWFTAIDDLKKFSEILFLLCSGGGVGYSVEKEAIDKLPEVKTQDKKNGTGTLAGGEFYGIKLYVVEDSREGWSDALNFGIKRWFDGYDVVFDYSKVRPAGAKLKTFGGTSAGPEPLKKLLDFTRNIILNAQGRKLTSIEVHDIVTKIGEIVVAGGSRRSAQISLSDLNDEEMKNAKAGKFYELYPHRTMANNSAIYNVKPTQQEFMDEWVALMKSGTGERGIFNRYGIKYQIPQRRIDKGYVGQWGGNPCMEIILRSGQACNLTEVVARENDTKESLLRKIRLATILGTYQSSLTDFTYLSDEWKKNCEEERLLGVSITGQFDCPLIMDNSLDNNILSVMKWEAGKINKEYAKRFGINESTAITCTKPSGTVSQLVNSASGAHPRYANYYIRRVRISAYDPLFAMLKSQGVKYYPEVWQKDWEKPNCVEINTRILDGNLNWVKAGELKVGDKIIGFDENNTEESRRKYKLAEVTHASRKKSQIFELELEDGTILKSTPDHMWLYLDEHEVTNWIRTDEIVKKLIEKNDIYLPKYINVTNENKSREAGYLAGIFDGEGFITSQPSNALQIGFVQNEGPVLSRCLKILDEFGYEYSVLNHGDKCKKVNLIGGRDMIFRFLSEIKPTRLINKFKDNVLEHRALWKLYTSKIIDCRESKSEIAVLSSSTKTYIAEGFAAHNTFVLEFPIKSPKGAVTRNELASIDQLEHWKRIKTKYAEHTVSQTVYVGKDEWLGVASWLWDNWEIISGLSFLPKEDEEHVYELAPYEEIDEHEFGNRVRDWPVLDFSKLVDFEKTDETIGSSEAACTANGCDIL